jgi:hypothetical protein
MNSNAVTKVFIKTRQYNAAYKRSGYDNISEFNKSIGLSNEVDYKVCYPFIYINEEDANRGLLPYIVQGGIPMGGYEELILVDERLFDYSKIKYEFYND